MNWIDRYHIIRRLLLAFFTYFFLKITNHIFCDGVASDALKISVYVSFAGIITFIIKFYHDSRNIEIKNKKEDPKLNGDDKNAG